MIFKPRLSRRTPRDREWYSELRTTLGPKLIGEPGSTINDLITHEWLVMINTSNNNLEIWQFQGEWRHVPVPEHPVLDQPQPDSMRRVSLAFDQLAHPVVAWEEHGALRISQYDPVAREHTVRGPWEGVDPAIANDGLWSLDSGASDIILFYLDTNRRKLCYRLQREVYAVENTLHTYRDPVILDQILPQLWRFSVLATNVRRGRAENLTSEQYPSSLPVSEPQRITVRAHLEATGSYFEPVHTESLPSDSIGVGITLPSVAEYFPPIETVAPALEGIAVGVTLPSAAEYTRPIEDLTPDLEGITSVMALPSGGDYYSPIIGENFGIEGISVVTQLPQGGTYEKP